MCSSQPTGLSAISSTTTETTWSSHRTWTTRFGLACGPPAGTAQPGGPIARLRRITRFPDPPVQPDWSAWERAVAVHRKPRLHIPPGEGRLLAEGGAAD